MRVLFTTQPGYGHLNPMIPYATALRDAGHEVVFATAPLFCPAVERAGFAAVGGGYDFLWERAHEFFPTITDAAKERRLAEFTQLDVIWQLWNPKMSTDPLPIIERFRPDIIVREWVENGATIAGALTGVPVVCASWGALPADPAWSRHAPMAEMTEAYHALRATHDLPPDNGAAAWMGQPVLTLLPPTWVTAPPWLARTGIDRPLVYATLGTVFNTRRRVRSALIKGFESIDADVVVTVGRDVDLDDIGSHGDHVHVEQFIDQAAVLDRASLLASHAGLGTMIGALYAGVPMVLVSFGVDQAMNAERAVKLDLAEAFDVDDSTPDRWHQAIQAGLRDDDRAERSASVRSECDALPDIRSVVPTLERLAAAAG